MATSDNPTGHRVGLAVIQALNTKSNLLYLQNAAVLNRYKDLEKKPKQHPKKRRATGYERLPIDSSKLR